MWGRKDSESEPLAPEPAGPDPEQAWKALTLVNDWIKHSEAKTGVAFAATGVSGTLLFNLTKGRSKSCDPLLLWIAILCGALILAAAACCSVALLPRLQIRRGGWPKIRFVRGRLPRLTVQRAEKDLSNLLFFSHVARRFKNEGPSYVEVLSTLTSDPETLTQHIAHQVHANATVAHRKYRWANFAVTFLVLDLLALAGVAIIVSLGG